MDHDRWGSFSIGWISPHRVSSFCTAAAELPTASTADLTSSGRTHQCFAQCLRSPAAMWLRSGAVGWVSGNEVLRKRQPRNDNAADVVSFAQTTRLIATACGNHSTYSAAGKVHFCTVDQGVTAKCMRNLGTDIRA